MGSAAPEIGKCGPKSRKCSPKLTEVRPQKYGLNACHDTRIFVKTFFIDINRLIYRRDCTAKSLPLEPPPLFGYAKNPLPHPVTEAALWAATFLSGPPTGGQELLPGRRVADRPERSPEAFWAALPTHGRQSLEKRPVAVLRRVDPRNAREIHDGRCATIVLPSTREDSSSAGRRGRQERTTRNANRMPQTVNRKPFTVCRKRQPTNCPAFRGFLCLPDCRRTPPAPG